MKVLVNKKDLYILENVTESHIETASDKDKFEIFDTLAEAEQYVFENKPCLSYNDVIKMATNCKHGLFQNHSKEDRIILINYINAKLSTT